MELPTTTDEQKMAEELKEIGIECYPVMKACVPRHMGTPLRTDLVTEEMSVAQAYEIYVNSPLRDEDFRNKIFNKNNK